MTRTKVVAYLGSFLASAFSAAIAGAVFNAPGWAIYLTFTVVMLLHRIGDRQKGEA